MCHFQVANPNPIWICENQKGMMTYPKYMSDYQNDTVDIWVKYDYKSTENRVSQPVTIAVSTATAAAAANTNSQAIPVPAAASGGLVFKDITPQVAAPPPAAKTVSSTPPKVVTPPAPAPPVAPAAAATPPKSALDWLNSKTRMLAEMVTVSESIEDRRLQSSFDPVNNKVIKHKKQLREGQ
eukprot:gene38344-47339_t